MVTSFRPRCPLMRDDTVLATVRPISNIQELYNQFSEYRLEILEERIRQQLKDLRDANSSGRRVPTKRLKAFLDEQERFLAHMNREMIDDEMVVKGILPPTQLSYMNGGDILLSVYRDFRSFLLVPTHTLIASRGRGLTSDGARRPVVVEIRGGAYSAGTASFNISPFGYPTLNASTTNDFVFVYPAYRLNVFGFLAGTDIKKAEGADLNVGLLDQQAALRWVHENIGQFGGDPRNVSLWGQSAGGGSVIAHVIANKGERRPKLFHRALVNSPYWVKQYRYNDPEAESVYTQMLNLTNCADKSNDIGCLRAVDQRALYNASLSVKPYKPWHTAYSLWSPVVDGEFLHERLSAAVDGKLNAELVWATSNTHEGERFVSSDLQLSNSTSALNSSAAGFDYWLRGYLAHFTTSDLTEPGRIDLSRHCTDLSGILASFEC
ncbi:carboxylesterase [Seiridium cupressi]